MLTMSASAGGFTMPSETASAIETISSAPLLVDDVGNRGNVFDGAEEVGRLDQHSGGLVVDGLIERFEIDTAILRRSRRS